MMGLTSTIRLRRREALEPYHGTNGTAARGMTNICRRVRSEVFPYLGEVGRWTVAF